MNIGKPGLPNNSCDTHVHVFNPGAQTVSPNSLAPADADVSALAAMHDALGVTRTVIVQPTAYGTDNSVTAAGIKALGMARARGVAVIDAATSDQRLQALGDGGFCAARLQMLPGGVIPWGQANEVAQLAATADWHVQLQLDGRTLPEREAQILAWPGRLVIDHVGKFLKPVAPDDPAFRCLLRLVDTGRVWVKLSAPYEVSTDEAPGYADVSRLARALVDHAPERMLWASNWPHLGRHPRPDDRDLLDLLSVWAPDAPVRDRILCDNAAEVYRF